MNVLTDLLRVLLVLGAAVKLLTLNLWRAVLFFAPGTVRLRSESALETGDCPEPLAPLVSQLERLGFVALSIHSERPLFHEATHCYDFVHPGERAFATLQVSEAGRPLFYFLTPLAPEGLVLTFESKRPTFGGLGRYHPVRDEVHAERLLHLHRERWRGLTPTEDFTPEARLQVGRAWYQGPGRREIRRQNLQGLLWTLVALAIVALLFGSHGE